MGGKHSRIYAEEKLLSEAEEYPLIRDVTQLKFVDFDIFKLLGRFPEVNKFNQSFNKINRDESIIIFISHVWLTELSSIPGRADFSHPDNKENDKYSLCVEAIQSVIENFVCAEKYRKTYLWIDYSCNGREIKTSSDVFLDKVLEVSDLVLTPLVDHQHESWDLLPGKVDYLVEYRATAWTGHLKSYLNRGWNRAEMFYSVDIPIANCLERCEFFLGECKHFIKRGYRPHLIYGTKESKAGHLPIVLAPLQKTQYAELNPVHGYFLNDKDKSIVQEVVEFLKFDRNSKVDEYKGSIDNEKKFGYGVMHYSNGNVYKGEFAEDMRDGRGKMTFANGDIYDGDWREDMMSGHGMMKYANGSVYIGKWSNNARHGSGTLQEKNWHLEGDVLSEYTGMWYGDKQNGWGITVMPNEEHEGEYKNGLRDGPGVLRDGEKLVVFDGMFVEGEICGYGMMNYENGDVYSGHFKNNMRQGKGRLFFKNGDAYDGDFDNNNIEGEGVMTSGCETYSGSFMNGMKNGQGEITFSNGDVFSSNFVNDQPCGHGVMKYANGRRVPLLNGRKKRLLTSCLMMTAAAVVIFAAHVVDH